VAFGCDFGENVEESLVGADDESGALDPPDFLAIHVLFLHHAKLIADFLVYISKECVGKVVFGAESCLVLRGVPRDAEDHGSGGQELLEGVAEAAGFNGAAGGVGSWIKEENDGFAFKVREAYSFPLVGLKREIRDFRIQFHGYFLRMVDRLNVCLHYGRAGRRASSRRSGVLAISALAVAGSLAAIPLCAQYPGQIEKKDKDVPALRAVAVLEWTGDLGKPKTSRLVPVTVFDGEQLQDGGEYLARPEPLAVAGGVEYILQKNGARLGLFDVHSAGQQFGSWVGFGSWKPMPSLKPKAPETAQKIDDYANSDRPVLHRKRGSGGDSSGGGSGSDSGENGQAPDPDRPTLHKKTAPDDAGNGGSSSGTSDSTRSVPAAGSGTSGTPGSPSGSDKPTTTQKSGSTPDASGSTGSDPDRPALKRGKAKQTADEGYVEDLPNAVDPDRPHLLRGKSTGGVTADETPTLVGLPTGMEQAVAVSDPRNRPEHPWAFSWADPGDELKMKADLEDLARAALGLQAPPAPAPKRTTATKTKANHSLPPAPAPLLDEEYRVFELAYGSGATLVLTARTDGPANKQNFVTLIAQPDLYGSLLVLFKSVTDGGHLDDKPQMHLIDAVDALADNRGELLFELRGSTQREFALYRVMRGTAKELFVTGGGATSPVEQR
jgi:hypothetical protein